MTGLNMSGLFSGGYRKTIKYVYTRLYSHEIAINLAR
jgi:hypothetical protein